MNCYPLVSVIIPTYNHAEFLRKALNSLCMQTYSNWEAIVVNNFSEDDTVAIVESFTDSRIRLQNFHNNGIIAASRNRGISLARGRYLAFLDSDDSWYPEKLTRCMGYFNHDVGLVCHGLRWVGKQKKDVFAGPKHRATFDALFDKGNCIMLSATMVKKDWVDAVGGFSEEPKIVTAEDYHLWLKLAKIDINMVFVDEVLGEYLTHSGNQSNSVLRHMSAVLCVIDEFSVEEKQIDFKIQKRVRQRHGLVYYGAGRAMQRNGQFIQSLSLIFRSIAYSPFFIKNYLAVIIGLVRGYVRWLR